jgi:hypothetical protein
MKFSVVRIANPFYAGDFGMCVSEVAGDETPSGVFDHVLLRILREAGVRLSGTLGLILRL